MRTVCTNVEKSVDASIQRQQHIVFILHVHQMHPFQFCLPMSHVPENYNQTMSTPPPSYSLVTGRADEQSLTLCHVLLMITSGLILFSVFGAIVAYKTYDIPITVAICGHHVYASKRILHVNKDACTKYFCHSCRSICECHVIK